MSMQSMELQKCNFVSVLCLGIMDIILVLCYLIEVIKGDRTIAYYVAFCFLALFPLILCIVAYRRDSSTNSIKYILPIGFLVFYFYVIFTTTSPVAYVYAFMLGAILVCYSNIKLSNMYTIAVSIGNVALVAYKALSHQITAQELPTLEIQVASVFLFSGYIYLSTSTLKKNNDARLAEIEQEKGRQMEMTERILAVSERMTNDINGMVKQVASLEEIASANVIAMQEVSSGNNEAADSVQMQMTKTEEIKQSIEQVSKASEGIVNNVKNTKVQFDSSQTNIDRLIEHVNISNEANANVSNELKELNAYTNQMQSIIELINNITSQTSLLSLNASIEAARAGEAGRGFAVVASEISNLAVQTQDATVDITALINNISNELKQVVGVIEEMIENANDQNEAAHNTAQSFGEIVKQTEQIYVQAEGMSAMVRDLNKANEEIMRGIETISAVTEEVAGHSQETYDSSSKNQTIVEELSTAMDGLSASARELVSMDNR